MSQIDKVGYLPLLYWFIFLFIVFYFVVFKYFLKYFLIVFNTRQLIFFRLVDYLKAGYLVLLSINYFFKMNILNCALLLNNYYFFLSNLALSSFFNIKLLLNIKLLAH